MISHDARRWLRLLARRAFKAARLARNARWRRGLVRGVGATLEHDALPLGSGYRTVIDVGANRGQFALYARERWPGARLFCFEPLAGPLEKLTAVVGGDPMVEVVAAAAGARDGNATINVSRSDDSSSLLEITSRQTETFAGTEKAGEEEVRVVTLDGFFACKPIERPALLKIDVQGYELEVLTGAEGVLEQIDSILVECSFVEFYAGQPLFGEVFRYLSEKGYSLRGGNVTSRDGQAWLHGDFVFERSGVSAQSLRAA